MAWHCTPVASRDEAAFLLFAQNQWPSSCGARRETFLKHPYTLTKNGFGHEDYALNIEAASAGIKHIIASGATLFYRQKAVSLMRNNDAKSVTQPYSELFDYQLWQKIPANVLEQYQAKVTLGSRFRSAYIRARDNKAINAVIAPCAALARKVTGKKLIHATLPEPILREWRKISKIETGLYPSPAQIRGLSYYDSRMKLYLSELYRKLCLQVKARPDYIFLMSWMVPGGSEKVVLNYLNSLKTVHPDWKIAVVTTLPVENTWRDKIPSNAYLVDFGNLTKRLSDFDRDLLLTRFLVELQTKNLHIVNSLLAYNWAARHQDLIKHNFNLSLSLFCHDIIPGTNGEGRFDYADPYAVKIYPIVKTIYTDNTAVIKHLAELNGFDPEKFKVHYQPVDSVSIKTGDTPAAPRPLKLLWASRVALQKNPTLLAQIATQLAPNVAKIDVFGSKEKELDGFSFPNNLLTLTYHGSYDGFSSLHPEQYDAFLYTSHIDGIPNAILEAAASGLPVIASNVGGIGDFIQNNQTGFLIDDYANPDAYVEVINRIHTDPSCLNQIRKNAGRLLEKQHSWTAFNETVAKDL